MFMFARRRRLPTLSLANTVLLLFFGAIGYRAFTTVQEHTQLRLRRQPLPKEPWNPDGLAEFRAYLAGGNLLALPAPVKN